MHDTPATLSHLPITQIYADTIIEFSSSTIDLDGL
jgi:hypothetical protein